MAIPCLTRFRYAHHNSARRVKTRKTRDLTRDAWNHAHRIKSRIRDGKRVMRASRMLCHGREHEAEGVID